MGEGATTMRIVDVARRAYKYTNPTEAGLPLASRAPLRLVMEAGMVPFKLLADSILRGEGER